jgi:hypothetical protein
VLVSQKSVLVTVYRRTQDWSPVVLASSEQALELKSIGLFLPIKSRAVAAIPSSALTLFHQETP